MPTACPGWQSPLETQQGSRVCVGRAPGLDGWERVLEGASAGEGAEEQGWGLKVKWGGREGPL